MIEIVNINAQLTLERYLAALGLQYFVEDSGFEGDYKVYGCGMFRPGEAYDEFVEAYSQGEMLGIIALTIEEHILASHEGHLRQLLGQVLMTAPKIFLADFQSAEWAPHYDIQGASHGGHPAWLCPPSMAENALSSGAPGITETGIVAKDLGSCITGALLGWPTIIAPSADGMGHKQNAISNHPLVRFAQRFNVTRNLAIEKDQLPRLIESLRKGDLPAVDPCLVEAAKIEAYATIQKLLPQPSPADDASQIDEALAVFGTSETTVSSPPDELQSNSAGMPRVINPGDPFDPSTHYGEYYYSPGPGMVYSNPDGEKVRYDGPGRDWESFDRIADIFRMIFGFKESRPTMVSLGCGFGSDVLRFRRKGWDAWGCDLSSWSVRQADPDVRDKIILGNICENETQIQLPHRPNLICTFDFWEHIFESDIDQLMADLSKWMPKGSFMANIICTNARHETDITISPEDGFTLDNSWYLVSGHVTGRRWHWWANRFHGHGFQARPDLCHLFQVARTEDPALSQAMSWRPRNLLIVEKK